MDKVYSGRAVGAFLYLPLGLYCLAVLIALPFLLSREAGWWALVIVVPFTLMTTIVLLNAYGAWASRLHLREDSLSIRAPQWRGCPLPPVNRIDVPWQEVVAVRRRAEFYQVPLWMGMSVTVYAIETKRGRAVFGGRYGMKLPEAMAAIAACAGVPIADDGEVQTGVFSILIGGAPPWDPHRNGPPAMGPAEGSALVRRRRVL